MCSELGTVQSTAVSYQRFGPNSNFTHLNSGKSNKGKNVQIINNSNVNEFKKNKNVIKPRKYSPLHEINTI